MLGLWYDTTEWKLAALPVHCYRSLVFRFQNMSLLNRQGSTGKSNAFFAMNPHCRGDILDQTSTFIIFASCILYIDVYAFTVNLLLRNDLYRGMNDLRT
jgi:hypothetical protein